MKGVFHVPPFGFPLFKQTTPLTCFASATFLAIDGIRALLSPFLLMPPECRY